MSDNDRKSMDDVLASIRRIVRTEKQDGTSGGAADDPADELSPSEADEPLLLTPEMRTDAGAAPTELAADIADASADATPGAPAPDPEALREMVRELLREELTAGSAGDTVRDIIRDELVHGQTGENISQNVLRVIRDEVERAVGRR